MSVLAGLGGGHLHDFAGTSLQHHVAVLAQGGALHGVRGGGARLTSREVKIGICHGAMGLRRCRDRTMGYFTETSEVISFGSYIRCSMLPGSGQKC